ncbi:MAG: hypothetical protein VW258_04330 [Thalassolituus sp.]
MTPDVLHEELRQQRDLFTEEHSTRLHRAISWWRAAEAQAGNPDLQFVTAWISLNACCLTADSLDGDVDFLPWIQRLVSLDKDNAIYDLLWHQYSGPVKALIKNPYVFKPFWEAQREGSEDWKTQFDASSVEALNCLSRKKVPELLSITLDRLDVLRQQVICGGATFESRVNRDQVTTGAQLLLTLLPVVLALMLKHPHESWGSLAFPVVSV